MSAGTITKEQFDELMGPMMRLAGMQDRRADGSLVKFHVPLTRSTSVKVEFVGPVGVDEYDALLAHVAFYKTLVPQEGEEKIGAGDPLGQLRSIIESIWDARAKQDGAPA